MKIRPTWDEYYLQGAEWVSSRSPDLETKHGCIIVDDSHRVVSLGYNGPVSGVDHAEVPTKRPDKYQWMIHAEDNAVSFAKQNLAGCTAYITGFPCVQCTRRMLQAGISRIVCGHRNSSSISIEERETCEKMASLVGVKIEIR